MRQLFLAFPKADSGVLTWLKMVFVCNASLAYLSCRILELHKYLLHQSPALSQTIIYHVEEINKVDLDKMIEEIWDYHPPKLFADIFEAVCGAIFIDCGYNVDVCSEILGPVLAPFFKSLKYANRIDPISVLIRWAVRVSRPAKRPESIIPTHAVAPLPYSRVSGIQVSRNPILTSGACGRSTRSKTLVLGRAARRSNLYRRCRSRLQCQMQGLANGL